MSKPLVYVSSPYTHGDPSINTHFQCTVFDRLLTGGLVIPYVPLWSHFQQAILPRTYNDWIKYDLDLIRSANFSACLRLAAENPSLGYRVNKSAGADVEVALFQELNRPVFYSIESLYDAVRSGQM